MIDIAALTEADKRREVRYIRPHCDTEFGRITSWNSHFIFVRYYTRIVDGHPTPRTGDTSEATSPEDLEFA